MWMDWLKNFSSRFQNVQYEDSVQNKIEKLVWDQFPSIASYMKTQQKSCSFKSLACLVGSITPDDFEVGTHLEIHKRLNFKFVSKVLGFTEEDRNQYQIQATEIADTAFRRIDVTLREIASQDVRFNVTSVADILRIIDNTVDDHNNNKSKNMHFNLLPPYKALLIQHVVSFITLFFTNEEDAYTRRHSLRGQLEEYRETAWQLFKNVLEKKTEDHITAVFFKQALAKSVIDHVIDLIPLDIQETMMLKFSHQKYSIIRDVMEYIAEHGDFEECYRYISDPNTFVQEWLTKQMHTCIFDKMQGNRNQYAIFAQKHVRKICIEIEKAVEGASTAAGNKFSRNIKCHSPVKRWMASFSSQLNNAHVLPISEYNFSHVTEKSDIDVINFTQIVLEQLKETEETICRYFMNTNSNNIKWKISPVKQLMDQLWGCTSTCPFCSEPCKSTDKDHTELGVDHQCLQHRIEGFYGTKWKHSDKLVISFCNVDVQCDTLLFSYQNKGCEEEWIAYKEYKTKYPQWYIEPSPDTSKYWMWMLCRYQKEFEAKHKRKFESIPRSWKNLSMKEALRSLKH
ncbi:unnamed protein product [Mytilus coruscus]|uniref:Interferon-induced very large GTPase 1-like n=1 Tax=Mytilus coruscus TaxID=42192 RepID=A0A6J8B7Z3_MYTCO|nr:unnamed protein product [Mytilus coruscus]